MPNSQNFQGLYPKPHWGPSEQTYEGPSEKDHKPHALNLRNSKFGPNDLNSKFLAHTLLNNPKNQNFEKMKKTP